MKHRHPYLTVLELEYVCEDVCEYARMDAELLVTADWLCRVEQCHASDC